MFQRMHGFKCFRECMDSNVSENACIQMFHELFTFRLFTPRFRGLSVAFLPPICFVSILPPTRLGIIPPVRLTPFLLPRHIAPFSRRSFLSSIEKTFKTFHRSCGEQLSLLMIKRNINRLRSTTRSTLTI